MRPARPWQAAYALAAVILGGSPVLAAGPPITKPSVALTLAQALQTALENQPQVRQSQAELAAAQAGADHARATLLPDISLSTSYRFGPSRQNVNQVAVPLTNLGNYALSVNADQLLYDFGQAYPRFRAAQGQVVVRRHDARQTDLTVRWSVREAFFNAMAKQALLQITRDTLANQLLHQRRIRSLVEIGTRAPIDLAQTSKDVAKSRLQVINAQSDLLAAKAELNQAMGVEGATDYSLEETAMALVGGEDESLERLVPEALANRPDVAGMAARMGVQEALVEAAAHAFLPSLKASAGAGTNGTLDSPPSHNWHAGVGLSWPLFAGGSQEAQARQEAAKLASLQAQADALRAQLRLVVEQARLAVGAAKAAVAAATEMARIARQQLELAEGRYAAGVGSVIELGNAQAAVAEARAQEALEAMKLATARARLLLALGRE